MNITTTLYELETPEVYEHEQSNVKYYMEEPRNLIVANVPRQTEIIYDLIANATGAIIEV